MGSMCVLGYPEERHTKAPPGGPGAEDFAALGFILKQRSWNAPGPIKEGLS